GAKRAMDFGTSVVYGNGKGAMLGIGQPHDKEKATYGNGTMIAFTTASKEQVDQIYAKALELGGTSEGAPGFRIPDVLYIGYVRDLDGNKLAFTYRVA
ncbi:MAG TPA: VOC family protein, partial [Spongiibacteraceae bacterium]|nr:VOC family protein [Spongiibacteraceae bacterium]